MFLNTRSKIHCKLQGILAKSCYVQCFFHFWPFFPCRKATKMTQNSISIPSCAQIPKNPRKKSKTPPGAGLGAKSSLAPPPPAKADIATAILTNVIEHLVLLLPPNKHAFTAKAVWADFETFQHQAQFDMHSVPACGRRVPSCSLRGCTPKKSKRGDFLLQWGLTMHMGAVFTDCTWINVRWNRFDEYFGVPWAPAWR